MEEMQVEDAPSTLDLSNLHILVVEDESTQRKIIERCLRNCGYKKVTFAENGRIALDIFFNAKSDEFQLILCDLYMPELDGLGLIRAVRQCDDEQKKDIPLVVISASEDLNEVYECIQNGADSYILKPIRIDVMKHIWQSVWKKQIDSKQKQKLGEKINTLEDQVQKLHLQFSEAIETPIHVITRTIEQLNQNESVTKEVKEALGVIVKSLGASNLYRPALTNFILSQDNAIDEDTQGWLRGELFAEHKEITSVTFPTATAWPEAPSELQSNEIRSALSTWDFDVWSHTDDQLLLLLEEMWTTFDLLNIFQIPLKTFRNWLILVKKGYRANPYHNWRHAFDVTQATYVILKSTNASQLLTHLDILGLLVASLCHDLDHPGLNNAYLIAHRTPLAVRYNDKSVLENHHSCKSFSVLGNKQDDADIFSGFSEAQFREVRKVIINCILATDLACHMEKVSKFESLVGDFSRDNSEHRYLFAEIILKCADISNTVRPGHLSEYWTSLVQEEFFCQGDQEKQTGLMISPFMDRNQPATAKMSVNFINFLVVPLFNTVRKLLPGLEQCCERLLVARTKWQRLLEESAHTSPSGVSDVQSTKKRKLG